MDDAGLGVEPRAAERRGVGCGGVVDGAAGVGAGGGGARLRVGELRVGGLVGGDAGLERRCCRVSAALAVAVPDAGGGDAGDGDGLDGRPDHGAISPCDPAIDDGWPGWMVDHVPGAIHCSRKRRPDCEVRTQCRGDVAHTGADAHRAPGFWQSVLAPG